MKNSLIYELNNTFHNNQWAKEEIKRDIEMNENKDTHTKFIYALTRGKFVTWNVFIFFLKKDLK